jgi:hypothetical protein
MKRLWLLFIFVILSTAGFAQEQTKEVGISVIAVKDKITANGFADFDLTISNNLDRDIDFFVAKNFFSENWRVTADPYIVSVGSGFSRNTGLRIDPIGFLTPAKYDLIVTIESRDGTISKEVPFKIEIIPFGEENVVTELVVDDNIDPRLGTLARVSLENLFNHDIEAVKISLDSELFEFERDISLKANEKKVEKFQLNFEDGVKLEEYEFRVLVKSGSDILGSAIKKVTLAPYSEVTEKVFRSNTFNKRIMITKENTGTEGSNEEVSLELTGVEKILARYNTYPDSIDKVNENYVVNWEFSLDPGDRKEIVVTLPYGTYLTALLVLVLLIYILLHVTRRKVVLVKRIVDVTKDKEGIRGIKIILHLTNRGNKAIEKIRVLDYLPKMVAASGKDFGTMRPSRVQRSKDGRMRLIWDLDGLDRGEERIISYIAKSKLSIIGKMLLPEAVVEYQVDGKHVHNRSNKLTLLTKATEHEMGGN